MKTKTIRYLFVVAIMAACASCSKDDAPSKVQVQPAFTYDITQVSGDAWPGDGQVGIYMLDPISFSVLEQTSNRRFLISTDGKLTPASEADIIYLPEHTQVRFAAYHPYSASATNGTLAVSVADQSTPEEIDILHASSEAVSNDTPAVSLPFEHKLTLLRVNLRSGDDSDLGSVAASIAGMNTTASMDVLTGTTGSAGNPADIIPLPVGPAPGYQHAFEAILIPAAAAPGRTMTFTTGQGTYQYDFDSGLAFTPGTIVNIDLEAVGPMISQIATATILPWTAANLADRSISGQQRPLKIVWKGHADLIQGVNIYRNSENITSPVAMVDADTVVTNSNYVLPSSFDALALLISGRGSGLVIENTASRLKVEDNVITILSARTGAAPFLVAKVADLDTVRNNLSGHYLQVRDLDLSGVAWSTIGTAATAFSGVYDGNGFAFDKLSVTASSPNTALFCRNDGHITRVTLGAGCSFASTSASNNYLAGICALNNTGGRISHCLNLASMTFNVTGNLYFGGICSSNSGAIEACVNKAVMKFTGGLAAGICPENKAGATVSDCWNYASLAGAANLGGISSSNAGEISRCINYADSIVSSNNGNGGISGISSGTITRCVNYGKIIRGAANTGGIAGNPSAGTISFCEVYNTVITGTGGNVGGVAGTSGANISDCQVDGVKIIATGNVAGGICSTNSARTIERCQVRNVVIDRSSASVTPIQFGGVVGYNNGGTVQGCNVYNTAVSANATVGGVAGYSNPAAARVVDCHTSGCTVTSYITGATNCDAGGVVGNNGGTIQQCSNRGSVIGVAARVGGICGISVGSILGCANLYAAGHKVEGANAVGGIAGYSGSGTAGTLRGCYNTGLVHATNKNSGGICGNAIPAASLVQGCYNAGNITAGAGEAFAFQIAGLAAGAAGKIYDCYWNGTGSAYPANYTDVLRNYQFSSLAWPADNNVYAWGVGGDPANGEFWKPLGSFASGGYPMLWWEQ